MSRVHGSSAVVKNGLILYLDAANKKSYTGTGTTWSDLSGNGNNATLVNGTAFNSANNGYFVTDGINDYAIVQNSASLQFTNQLTVCMWFKRVDGVLQRLISKMDVQENATFRVALGTGGRLFYETNDGVTRYILGNVFPVFTGGWEFFTFTVTGTTREVYQNTTLIASDSFTNNLTNTTYPITIGANILTDVTYTQLSTPGVMLYNRALSLAEIKQNFEATRGRYGI